MVAHRLAQNKQIEFCPATICMCARFLMTTWRTSTSTDTDHDIAFEGLLCTSDVGVKTRHARNSRKEFSNTLASGVDLGSASK
jgi:hypothetical protein